MYFQTYGTTVQYSVKLRYKAYVLRIRYRVQGIGYRLWVFDNLLFDHVGLPQVIIVAVNLVVFCAVLVEGIIIFTNGTLLSEHSFMVKSCGWWVAPRIIMSPGTGGPFQSQPSSLTIEVLTGVCQLYFKENPLFIFSDFTPPFVFIILT